MQSNEQFYRNLAEQSDYFDADLADAHRRMQVNATSASAKQELQETASFDLAEQFMQALQEIESTKEVEPLISLFSETADLMNLAMHHPLQGRDHIRQFWQNYVSVFDDIHSHFTHVSRGGEAITLEWISEGTLASGEPLSYRGVSILETQNGQVQHFRTYYDSAAFLPQNAK
jgi:ketosteroid isomerase-like protein